MIGKGSRCYNRAVTNPDTRLRRGWTTGACACAAAKAAVTALYGGGFPDPVTITLPSGKPVSFALAPGSFCADGTASAGVIKDAGDDPDITHGVTVIASVRAARPGSGVTFHAGDGVGTVTLPGLPLAVGEPAINPKPRQQIIAAVRAAAGVSGAAPDPDLAVTIAIPGGAELAKHTANPRLGIAGGLSVLGTTGVVIPYSCAAWVHSIHRGVDVARATGLTHVAASTGRTSEAAVAALYALSDHALIDMGDFAGATLKYLRRHPLPRVTIAGGFAKLSKFAAGARDLHSSRSHVDTARLARDLGAVGAPTDVAAAAAAAVSAGQVLALAGPHAGPLASRIAGQVREVARAALAGGTEVDVVVTDRAGAVLARTVQL